MPMTKPKEILVFLKKGAVFTITAALNIDKLTSVKCTRRSAGEDHLPSVIYMADSADSAVTQVLHLE